MVYFVWFVLVENLDFLDLLKRSFITSTAQRKIFWNQSHFVIH